MWDANQTVWVFVKYRTECYTFQEAKNTVWVFVKYRTGYLTCLDANQTVRVFVEYRAGVTVKGKGEGTPFIAVCCKEWAVTINPATTLENSTNFAFSSACL